MLAMLMVMSLVLVMMFYGVAQAGEITVADTIPLTHDKLGQDAQRTEVRPDLRVRSPGSR